MSSSVVDPKQTFADIFSFTQSPGKFGSLVTEFGWGPIQIKPNLGNVGLHKRNPTQVSQAVRHLAGEGADFMTGQTAILDGGRIMR